MAVASPRTGRRGWQGPNELSPRPRECLIVTSQIKDRARNAHDHVDLPATAGRATDRRATAGVGAATHLAATHLAAALPAQARETAVENTPQLQDAVLGVLRPGQDATLALVGMWTETVRRSGPFGVAPARAAIGGGYDLLTQLLARQRRFVDALIDQQRRFAEGLFSPPEHR